MNTNRKKVIQEEIAKEREGDQRREAAQHRWFKLEALLDPLRGMTSSLGQVINTHMNEQGFWQSENVGEKFMLIVSEVSEAMEADRKNLDSDKIPAFTGVEEELADAIIRILDFSQQNGLRLADAIIAKMQYNLTRPYMHGKKY